MTDEPAAPRTYIIYTWPYNENSGGIIFEHRLADELNRLGERAFVRRSRPIQRLGPRSWLRYWLKRGPMRIHPDLVTPLARRRDMTRDAIVVYGERIMGNPLRARNVVRWLMYRPGLKFPYSFGEDEMFFRAGEMSDLPELTGGAPELTMWTIDRTYRDEGRTDRSGICYMVRKGNEKPRIPETEAPDAIRLDGMSHVEINDVFNRCHTFYTYDEATMYSQYAAVCGCTSVVVPGLYPDRAAWAAQHSMGRFGVAYGVDDIPHAVATRTQVLPMLETKEAEGRESVRRFVELTKARFPIRN